jgi:hypothetical protein
MPSVGPGSYVTCMRPGTRSRTCPGEATGALRASAVTARRNDQPGVDPHDLMKPRRVPSTPRLTRRTRRNSKIAITMEDHTHLPSGAARKAAEAWRAPRRTGQRSRAVAVVAVSRCCTHDKAPAGSLLRGLQSAVARTAVDLRGFEPLTLSLRTRCATGLRYRPLRRVKP